MTTIQSSHCSYCDLKQNPNNYIPINNEKDTRKYIDSDSYSSDNNSYWKYCLLTPLEIVKILESQATIDQIDQTLNNLLADIMNHISPNIRYNKDITIHNWNNQCDIKKYIEYRFNTDIKFKIAKILGYIGFTSAFAIDVYNTIGWRYFSDLHIIYASSGGRNNNDLIDLLTYIQYYVNDSDIDINQLIEDLFKPNNADTIITPEMMSLFKSICTSQQLFYIIIHNIIHPHIYALDKMYFNTDSTSNNYNNNNNNGKVPSIAMLSFPNIYMASKYDYSMNAIIDRQEIFVIEHWNADHTQYPHYNILLRHLWEICNGNIEEFLAYSFKYQVALRPNLYSTIITSIRNEWVHPLPILGASAT